MNILHIHADGPFFDGVRPAWQGEGWMVYAKGQSWSSIVQTLPPEVRPEVVLVSSVDYAALPLGIEDCEFPLVFKIGDWNVSLSKILPVLGMADALLTDRPGQEVLARFGFKSYVWSQYGNPRHWKKLPIEKTWDITFVGNFNHGIHTRRARLLGRLARLSDRYRIGIFSGVYGQEYQNILAKSRVVFNLSVRGELNMRTYETACVRSVPLIERDNQEAFDVFPDGIASVSYSEDDFEETLEALLSDTSRCERISNAAHEAYALASSKQHQELCDVLSRVCVTERRRWREYSEVEKNLARIGQWQLANGVQVFPLASAVMMNKEFITKLEPERWFNAYLTLWFQGAQQISDPNAVVQPIFQRAVKLDSRNSIFHWSVGNVAWKLGQQEVAYTAWIKAIENLQHLKISDFVLIPETFSRTRSMIEKVCAGGDIPIHIVGGVLFRNLALGRPPSEACWFLEKSLSLDASDPSAWLMLGEHLYRQGNRIAAIAAWKKSLELQPWQQSLRRKLGEAAWATEQETLAIQLEGEARAFSRACMLGSA